MRLLLRGRSARASVYTLLAPAPECLCGERHIETIMLFARDCKAECYASERKLFLETVGKVVSAAHSDERLAIADVEAWHKHLL